MFLLAFECTFHNYICPQSSLFTPTKQTSQGTLTHGMLGPVCEMTEDGSSLQSSVDGSGVPRTMRRQGSLGLVEAQDEDVSLPFPASSLQSKLAKQRDTYNTSPPYSPLRPSSPLPDSPRHPRRSNTTGHTPTTNSSNLQADQADTSPHAHAHLTLNDKSAAARSTSSDLQVKLPNPKEPFSSTEFTEDYRDSTSSSSKVRFSPFGFSLQGMGAGTAAKADSLYAQSLKSHASGRFREMASPISKDQVGGLLTCVGGLTCCKLRACRSLLVLCTLLLVWAEMVGVALKDQAVANSCKGKPTEISQLELHQQTQHTGAGAAVALQVSATPLDLPHSRYPVGASSF